MLENLNSWCHNFSVDTQPRSKHGRELKPAWKSLKMQFVIIPLIKKLSTPNIRSRKFLLLYVYIMFFML